MATGRPEIRALTGIRGFAALWVVLFHLKWDGLYEAFPSLDAIRPLGDAGFLGVDLFFILSGFILTYTYADAMAEWRPREHVRFELVRLARIYPVHIVTLMVLAVPVIVCKLLQSGGPWMGPRFGTSSFVPNVLLVHAWGTAKESWNVPSWSISVEWAAYLAFPLACPLVARIRSCAVAVVGALAMMAATIVALRALGFGDSLAARNPGGLVRIAGEFAAGCLLCRAFLLAGPAAERWSLLTIPCAAAIVALAAVRLADPWAMPLFGVLIVSLAADRGPAARFLGTRWNLLWGRASYSLYMTHGIVLSVIAWLVPHDFPPGTPLARRAGWFAVAGVSLAATALATWRFVEEPGRRILRRRATVGSPSE